MLIAAYCSVGFAVLGIHAWSLWRRGHNPFHAAALKLTLPMLLVVTPLQALTGDFAAKHLARYQPSKLAAAEALWETQRGAPLLIGGIPLDGGRKVILGLHIPKALSFLAKADFDAEVTGLADIPENERPPVLIPHLAFQVMVGAGFTMLALMGWAAWLLWKKQDLSRHRRFLMLATFAGPLGLIAVEAGWVVTEVGRQPWIIRGVMLVSEAVTPMPGLVWSLLTSVAVYIFLGLVVLVLIYRHVVSVPIGYDAHDSDSGDTAPGAPSPAGKLAASASKVPAQ
jgi:cytochrome bd ubiquinol oxidase subunit I